MGVYGGRWNGAERKKKVTADGNKKDPKEKGKVADVRTKARPSSRCLGPAIKYFGRDLIFKGAAPDKSRVEAIAQTDESHQRIADDLCRRRATPQKQVTTVQNPAGTSSCSRPKIGKSTTRIQESRRHESWPTNDFRPSRGPPVSEVCSVSLVRGTSTVSSCSTSSCLFSSTDTRGESTTHRRPPLQSSAVPPYDCPSNSNHIYHDQSLGTSST